MSTNRIANNVFSGTLYETRGPFDSSGDRATFTYTVTLGNPPVSVTQTKQLARLVFRAPGTVCR